MTMRHLALLTLCSGFACAAADAQVLALEEFNDGPGQWEGNCNWDPIDGNPGGHMHVPLSDFFFLSFRTTAAGSPFTGDLTRHGGPLEFSLDIRTVQLLNFNQEPMDPAWFPVVFQFVDATDPLVSVYYTGPGMPQLASGWTNYSISIADPTSTTLPPGWGGTGAEDPVTFEPMLPPDRTFTSVLQNIGEVRVTTAEPGMFYTSSFWEAGWDNVKLTLVGGTTPCYANCDQSTTEPVLNVADFSCFLQQFAQGCP